MSTATVLSSDNDKHRSMYMGPDVQVQALLWERTKLDKVSENVRLGSPPAGEQREVGEAREDLFGARAEGPCLVGDLKCDGFLEDMAAKSVD